MRITVHMNSKSLKMLCKRLITYVCKITKAAANRAEKMPNVCLTNGINNKRKKVKALKTQQDLNTVKCHLITVFKTEIVEE